ncbi:glycosyltransferase [Photobacterium kishitanii]|uniref:glycosyltransferase n=1 Tax=Photobacterium kishitanii TaxID=318456 RepID=UPI002739694C|nr:glycosyltransferase [Photobacterium kishitanii]
MNNKILLSIITPSFNSSKTISKTLESIKELKDKSKFKIEHIIVDGLSKDNTINIVNSIGVSDLIISESDEGIYDAINKGINVASGKYICCLMSDDFYSVDELLYVVDYLNSYNYEYIVSDLIFLSNKKKYKKIKNPEKRNKALEMPMNHPCLFIRHDIQRNIGLYNLDFKISSDYDFCIRLLNEYSDYKYINKYCVYMSDGGASDLESFRITCKERLEIRLKYFNKSQSYYLYIKEYLTLYLRVFKRKIWLA